MNTLWDFRGKRITVMGLGRFGGGVGTVKFLIEQGALVTLTDLEEETELAESLSHIDVSRLANLHLGGHQEEDFCDTELVVASPAVPRDNSYLKVAHCSNVPVTSEIALFWQFNQGRILAVTGSNGKSTTTALLHSIVKATGKRCWLGGNIGHSLLPEVHDIQPDDFVVLELSSFQPADLDRLFSSPELAVVTNFSPNHLDWHGSLNDYRYAKQSILRWQCENQKAVLNHSDAEVNSWPTHGERWGFGTLRENEELPEYAGVFHRDGEVIIAEAGEADPFPLRDALQLPGEHNLQNALAASAAALSLGIHETDILAGIREFQPLPHRLQFVAEIENRRFYNDSLATTPESTMMALEAFTDPIVLLAGGYDKQIDLSRLAQTIQRRTRAVALMGQTAEQLADLMESCKCEQRSNYYCCEGFERAFQWAIWQSQPGDIILLSPGCASYDWFKNFEERGDRFCELVHAWSAVSRPL